MNIPYLIGLGVHKGTIAIASISSLLRENAPYHETSGGASQVCERVLRKLAKKLKVTLQKFSTQAEPHKYGNQLFIH